MLTNILQYLDATAHRLPDKIAFSDGAGGMTFAELDAVTHSIGSALCRRGYSREPIAVLMDKHPAEIAAFFGIIRAGCFYAAMDADMPAARMGLILSTLTPRVLICDAKNFKKAVGLVDAGLFAGQILVYEDLSVSAVDEPLLSAVRAAQIDCDPIYVVFTSGSTGVPKGVAACHRSVIDYTESLCEAIGFSEDTVFANQTPLYFDAPLKEIMPTVKFGATCYLVPRMLFSFPVPLCKYLVEHKVNTVCWVVSALCMISSLGALTAHTPTTLTTVCFGSEVFPRTQYEMWRAALPDAKFYNLYGPTEATGMSCYWEARDLSPDEPIPVGKPFRNTDILLLTADGRRAAPLEEGEICMRGTCVTLGYYNNPTKTAEAFIQNPLNHAYPELIYRTGDLGKYNERGELVFLCRKDAQIKLMGHRVELGEIETAADAAGVSAACCVFDTARQRLVLYYAGNVSALQLGDALKERLPRYMLPAALIQLPALPHTPNGKIDRKRLQEDAETAESHLLNP